MNNETNDRELENLLRGLAPAAVSPALRQRVDEELKLDMSWLSTSRSKPQRTPRWLTSASWAAMGAAAAIAVMSHLPEQQSRSLSGATALAAAPAVLPAATIREWDAMQDGGSHTSRSRLAEKHALVISRELGTWVDPRYAQMTVEIPSQNKLLQPVSFR